MCSELDPLSRFKDLKWGYLSFHRKRLEPRVLPWQRHSRCHSVFLWCTFLVPSLKNTAPIFLDWVLYCFNWTTYDVITILICIIQNVNISKNKKKIFQKGKRRSSLFWKAFQISSNYFLLHRHLKGKLKFFRFKIVKYETRAFKTNSFFFYFCLIFLGYREQSLLILSSVFRVGYRFYPQFQRLCCKTIGSYF